jgi:hypothetical protein
MLIVKTREARIEKEKITDDMWNSAQPKENEAHNKGAVPRYRSRSWLRQ